MEGEDHGGWVGFGSGGRDREVPVGGPNGGLRDTGPRPQRKLHDRAGFTWASAAREVPWAIQEVNAIHGTDLAHPSARIHPDEHGTL